MFFRSYRAFVCGVGAGFDKLSVGIKDIGERAPKSMVKCEIELIVKYGIKSVGAGSPINFSTHK
jgi:hypothetical protein